MIFRREDLWTDGNIQFAHILRKEKDETMQVNGENPPGENFPSKFHKVK